MNQYLILDATLMGSDIDLAKAFDAPYRCLYEGKAATQLASVAPYLFQVNENQNLLNWFAKQKGKDKWGIILESRADFKTIHSHFRKFMIVKTETGKKFYLRFYDPRVLKDFLETCNAEQLRVFFGRITQFEYFDSEHQRKSLQFEKQQLLIN